jgi:glycosyltransferase involved in cell wall biosynthesis
MKTTYNIPQKLVIAGMKDFKFQELFDQAIRLKMDKEVVFTGRVDQDDLPFIYNGADLFVYPSFAEGFGIPPLEAMACGVPVITSNTTSLPEVIGDAGIMFNPWDIKEICNAMQMVLFDTVLQRKLIARGLKQAKKFSWQKSAEKVLKCYEDIYEKSIKDGILQISS